MTDNETLKALEEAVSNKVFPEDVIPTTIVKQDFLKDVLAIINRQKTEIEQLGYTLLGVMHFVDKWLDENELKQDEVNRADTMRHKTLQIIEEQQAELDRLETVLSEKLFCITQLKGENFALTNERDAYKNLLKNAKTEAVKELLEQFKIKYANHSLAYTTTLEIFFCMLNDTVNKMIGESNHH